MSSFRKFGVLAAVVFALGAIGAANASAAQFTASATGSLSGSATATQVFTFNGGQVKCTKAATSGTITSTATTEWHATVGLSGCVAFGFATVHASAGATILYTSFFNIHFKGSLTITVTGAGCSITIGPQSVGSVGYSTNGSKVKVTPNVSGITYTSTGGLCGSSGANGTYTGTSELERVGGGSLSFDP